MAKMKMEITRATFVCGLHKAAGSIVEVEEIDARSLVASGKARAAKKSAGPAKSPSDAPMKMEATT